MSVEGQAITTGELLTAWRETTRAAELAQHLATLALDAAERSERDHVGAAEIAGLAERAAEAAEAAASSARAAADRAAAYAAESRDERLRDADEVLAAARTAEDGARERYHRAVRNAERRRDPAQA